MDLPDRTSSPAASDPSLERFARLVRSLLGVPVALVTLVSADEQVFPGALGLPEPWQTTRSTPLSHSFCQHVVLSREPLVIADAREHPLVRDNLAIPDLGVVAYAGHPLVGADGDVVGSLCAIDTEPRHWTTEHLAALADLAEACSTQLQLTAARQAAQASADRMQQVMADREEDRRRWELAADATGVGSFDWHLAGGSVRVDQRLLAIYGVPAAEAAPLERDIGFFRQHLHPEDAERVSRAVATAVEDRSAYAVQCRIVLPGGDTRWVQIHGHLVLGADGTVERIIGATFDTTAEHEGEVRTARVLEAMPAGYLFVDREWRFTVVNDAAEQIVGVPREELLGVSIYDAFPANVGSDFERAYRAAVDTGTPQTVQAFYPEPLDRWFEVLCWPTPDGLALFFTDTTGQVRTLARAEAAAERLALLASVNRALLESADVRAALGDLPESLVPALADGCVLTLMQEDGRPVDIGSWHADPAVRPLLSRYARIRIAAQSLTSPLARALATGQTVRSTAADVQASLADGEAKSLLPDLQAAHVVYVPVRGRDRVRGVISLFCGPARVRDRADEQTAADIADRVGLALDNAALLAAQSQVAEGLQRSLLTEPPEPDHAQVVVRYVPASESVKVGGDWYDAFLQTSGQTMLVIGDVVGHDIAAAAAMGQLRGLLRGIAAYTDAGPAEVLRGLDAAMQLLQIPTLATAAVARFEQTTEELAQGVTRMVWSNAGHPPPVVIHPDGTLAVLAEHPADLLLGVDAHARRAEHTVVLDRGSTVLLYTDGLVERRGSTLDDDMARLEQAIADVGAATLDELCDGLVDRLVQGRNDDDIALVAVRLHRQDRPRPVEAGPNDVPPELPPDPATPEGPGRPGVPDQVRRRPGGRAEEP